MGVTRKAERGIVSSLGLLAHLEAMRDSGVGIQNIEINERAATSSAALRVWEDSNFPYRLPADLRAFLCASNGFSLAWTATQHRPPSGGAEGSGEDIVIGRISVDALSAITRLPLDADDLRDMAASRARATAAAAATAKTKSFPRRRSFPPLSSPCSGDGVSEASRDSASGEGRPPAERGTTADDAPSSGVTNMDSRAYGIAAFSLDSSCEVGRVALVYGGIPVVGCPGRTDGSGLTGAGGPSSSGGSGSGSGSNNHRERRCRGTRAAATQALSNPEVWLQDLSCRWHFLAGSFTNYFRMMVVHLGVVGWQQAFTPVGLSPNTEQCMRFICPDRLLFDQLEWQMERKNTNSAREAAVRNGGQSFY